MKYQIPKDTRVEFEIYDATDSLCEVHRDQNTEVINFEAHELVGEYDFADNSGKFMRFKPNQSAEYELYECIVVDSANVIIR